jgi:hypothetical protein
VIYDVAHPVLGMSTFTAPLIDITLGGNQVRLRLPPKAAPAEGRPKNADRPLNQSREAHLAAWPLHSP